MIRRILPPPLKNKLRAFYKRVEARYKGWRYAFTKADLAHALRQLGIESGDIVFVHSAHSAFGAFRGNTTDIIETLQNAVSPGGVLLMPTFSAPGLAVDYARKNKMFDPQNTPSQMGLITEFFRRSPDVSRSLHPTHSIAGWGERATQFLADNHLAQTPCGRGSPLFRLLEANGKVLLLGVDIRSMSLFHTVEELLESQMPFSPFTQELFTLGCRIDGQIVKTGPMRLYQPDVSRKRRLEPLAAILQERGKWRESATGNLRIISLQARDVLSTLQELAGEGVFMYEGYLPKT